MHGRDDLVHDDGDQRAAQIRPDLARGVVDQSVPHHDVIGPLPEAHRDSVAHDDSAAEVEASARTMASTVTWWALSSVSMVISASAKAG